MSKTEHLAQAGIAHSNLERSKLSKAVCLYQRSSCNDCASSHEDATATIDGALEWRGWVFKYQIFESDQTAKLTWRGTWDLPLEPHVLKAWQAVASERVGCKLQVVTEILDANVVIASYGDAIRYLTLLNTVVHPVSLWQIRKETAHQSKSRYP